jgi:hypothetical protein
MPLTYNDLLRDARIRQRVEWCCNAGHPLPDNLQQAIENMDYMSEKWLNDDVGRSVDRIRLWINTNLRMDLDEPALTLVGEQVRLRRPSLTAEQLSCLPITEVAAILFESEAQASANNAAPKTTAGSMTWQEAAERLERLRGQGESFTSQAKLAEQFGCSSATINKAIRNTPSLQTWAKPTSTTTPRAQSLTEVVTDRTAQRRELKPEDEVALREFIETAAPDVRAWFLALPTDKQLEVLDDSDPYHKILGRHV